MGNKLLPNNIGHPSDTSLTIIYTYFTWKADGLQLINARSKKLATSNKLLAIMVCVKIPWTFFFPQRLFVCFFFFFFWHKWKKFIAKKKNFSTFFEEPSRDVIMGQMHHMKHACNLLKLCKDNSFGARPYKLVLKLGYVKHNFICNWAIELVEKIRV